MPTRNIVTTDHQEDFIGSLVSDGHYQNASEVLRAGLRLLEGSVEQKKAELESIRNGVIKGMIQVRNNEFAEGDGEKTINDALSLALNS